MFVFTRTTDFAFLEIKNRFMHKSLQIQNENNAR